MCVCVRERERELECVYVCVRERVRDIQRKRVIFYTYYNITNLCTLVVEDLFPLVGISFFVFSEVGLLALYNTPMENNSVSTFQSYLKIFSNILYKPLLGPHKRSSSKIRLRFYKIS